LALRAAEEDASPVVVDEDVLVFQLFARDRAFGLDVLEQHAVGRGFFEVLVRIGLQLWTAHRAAVVDPLVLDVGKYGRVDLAAHHRTVRLRFRVFGVGLLGGVSFVAAEGRHSGQRSQRDQDHRQFANHCWFSSRYDFLVILMSISCPVRTSISASFIAASVLARSKLVSNSNNCRWESSSIRKSIWPA